MLRVSLAALCVAIATTLAGASSSSPQTTLPPPFAGTLTALPSPASDGAAQPNLTTDASGRVWLSWLEPDLHGGHRFRLASLEGSTWSKPVTIAEGPNFLANWADFPSVFAAADGTLAAHWLERGRSRSEYGIRMRTSKDSGRTWSAVLTPHRDETASEHGFVSFFDAPEGGIGLVWLDGRETATGGNMTLRATTLRNGALGPDTLVDPRVCDCCQTSAATTPSGVVVAYRDRSDKEIRDISLSALRKGRWTPPSTVHADKWEINGCPVNGPVVTASGHAVAVAWFTGVGGTPRAHVAFSRDEGATFASPIRVDTSTTLGRLGLVMPGPDRVLVSALERTSQGAQLAIRDVRLDGRVSAPTVVTAATPDRSGGFARLALSGRRLVVAWTDVRPNASSRVSLASGVIQ